MKETPRDRYVISWESRYTGMSGIGKAAFPKEQAQRICDEKNTHNPNILHYPIRVKDERE